MGHRSAAHRRRAAGRVVSEDDPKQLDDARFRALCLLVRDHGGLFPEELQPQIAARFFDLLARGRVRDASVSVVGLELTVQVGTVTVTKGREAGRLAAAPWWPMSSMSTWPSAIPSPRRAGRRPRTYALRSGPRSVATSNPQGGGGMTKRTLRKSVFRLHILGATNRRIEYLTSFASILWCYMECLHKVLRCGHGKAARRDRTGA